MLLDPFEEQSDCSAQRVELGDGPCRQREGVSRKDHPLTGFGARLGMLVAILIALAVPQSGIAQTIWRSYDVTPQSGSPQAFVTDTSGQERATVELYVPFPASPRNPEFIASAPLVSSKR